VTAAVYDYDAIARRARELELSGIVEAPTSTEEESAGVGFMYGIFAGAPHLSCQISVVVDAVLPAVTTSAHLYVDDDCP
jgi:hypothetical protein